MALIYKSKSSDWPNGLAHKIADALKHKYQPQDTMTRVELRHQLNKVTLKKGADPATLFEQLSALENRYNTSSRTIDEDDLIAVVIDAAPQEYQSVLTDTQLRLGNRVKLEHLSKAMNALWRTHAVGKDVKQEGDEMLLNTFDGFCFGCKKKGHKAHECPEKKGRKIMPGMMGKITCNHCGKPGHKQADCWQKEENADKRPQGYRKPAEKEHSTEQGQANVDKGTSKGTEYLLTGMTFPLDQQILSDPNVWIADSAATVHTTPHSVGMSDGQEATARDSITVGNGAKEQASQIASIEGAVCDKYGNELSRTKLTDVTHLPSGKFNLFSLTKMQKEGWLLKGNREAIWLTKDDNEVVFDMKVPTNKGLLFAMYFKRGKEIAAAATDSLPRRMPIKKAHAVLGHSDEDSTRRTAAELGIEITRGLMRPCDACAAAKAKQKNVPKQQDDHVPATGTDLRIFLDIATIKKNKERSISYLPQLATNGGRKNKIEVYELLPNEERHG
jgi:hypothetical protein